MTIKYSELSSCDEIDQSVFGNENWYLMAWGMGDAINAVLFLESRSVSSYKILCPPRNLSAIKYILENFVGIKPKCCEVVVYPSQDGYPIPEENILMSNEGFGPNDIYNAHEIGRLKVMHFPPAYWHHVQRLDRSGIYKNIIDYEKTKKSIDERVCVLFPERGDSYQISDEFWNVIVSALKERGYAIYVNRTTKSDVYLNEKIFEGTYDLEKPEIKDLFEFVCKHKNLIAIGQRSGIFDMLKYFECRKIIFYTDVEDPKMTDSGRALYEWCHLSEDIYTKNTIELKLSKYNPKVLDLIIP